jgi:hypothetical protein
MNKKVLIFVSIFILSYIGVFAQGSGSNWVVNPKNKSLVCPNENSWITVTLPNKNGGATGCLYEWTIYGGVFPLHNNVTKYTTEYTNAITVKWNPSATAYGRIVVKVTMCAEGDENTYTYYLRSVANETPRTTLVSPISVQKGVRLQNFHVNRIKVPFTGIQDMDNPDLSTPVYADEYEWNLPVNRPLWRFEGQLASTRTIRTTEPNINVEVDALNAGSVTVRGVISSCGGGLIRSNELGLSIIRTKPYLSTIRARGNNNVITTDGIINCGVVDTITFTTNTPQGLTARYYKWRFSYTQTASWKFINPTTGTLQDTLTTFAPTVKVLTTPNTQPTIGVLANINYGNNIFEDSFENFLAIQLNRIQAKITSATAQQPDLCVGETSETTIRTIGQDATDFRYENLTPRTISIPANQTGNSCRVTTLMAGVGQVKVTAINACGDGESQIVQIGVFEGVPFNSGVFNQQKAPYCPNQVHGVTIETVENTISYQWVALSRDINVSGFGTQGYIIPRREGIHQFAVITANPCASDTTIYQIYANYSNCGFQPWQNQLVIYPNPAKDVLNIALPTESSATAIFRLIDGFGQVRKETTAATQNNNTITFSVTDLPQGIYYLHVIDHDFTKQYQIAITK